MKKICKSCNEEKVLDSFNINPRKPDGYFNECKVCMSKRYFEKKALTPKKIKQVIETPSGEKQCSHCKQILPYPNFNKNKDNSDGFSSKCKQCYNDTYIVNKEYHNANALLRYYEKKGVVPDNIELLQSKADKSNYNNHIFDKQQLTDLQIERLERKKIEWRAIFAERCNDVKKMLDEYEKSPADGLKIQLKFYEEVRPTWKLKYKNTDRFERQFIAYAKGESNVRW